jgi:hypothetical protein
VSTVLAGDLGAAKAKALLTVMGRFQPVAIALDPVRPHTLYIGAHSAGCIRVVDLQAGASLSDRFDSRPTSCR